MSENVCTSCHGSGTQWSGVEYYGQHEMVGCDECWGTGFDDVLAGVDDLRAEVARLTAERDAARKRADERCEFDYKDGYEDGRDEISARISDLTADLEYARRQSTEWQANEQDASRRADALAEKVRRIENLVEGNDYNAAYDLMNDLWAILSDNQEGR